MTQKRLARGLKKGFVTATRLGARLGKRRKKLVWDNVFHARFPKRALAKVRVDMAFEKEPVTFGALSQFAMQKSRHAQRVLFVWPRKKILIPKDDLLSQLGVKSLPSHFTSSNSRPGLQSLWLVKNEKGRDLLELLGENKAVEFDADSNLGVFKRVKPDALGLKKYFKSRDWRFLYKNRQKIARQLARFLVDEIAAGVSHNDIDPRNIVVDKKARIRVIDWSFARLPGNRQKQFTNALKNDYRQIEGLLPLLCRTEQETLELKRVFDRT